MGHLKRFSRFIKTRIFYPVPDELTKTELSGVCLIFQFH